MFLLEADLEGRVNDRAKQVAAAKTLQATPLPPSLKPLTKNAICTKVHDELLSETAWDAYTADGSGMLAKTPTTLPRRHNRRVGAVRR